METASLTLKELEDLLEEYPWFTLARKEYIFRLGEKGGEALRAATAESGIFLPSRSAILKEMEQKRRKSSASGKVVTVGGDYFDKQEYETLEKEGLTFDTSTLVQSGAGRKEVAEDEFCTETLARVYLEQEFYQRAIEIYEKLILQYPQKSAYFAALIDKAKNIKQ